MCKFFGYAVFILVLSCISFAQQPDQTPLFDVKLEANTTARSTITTQNRCKKKHNFELKLENITFIEIAEPNVSVAGGKNKVIPIVFNTMNMTPAVYEGNILVICLTCKSEPTCTQDRSVLPVRLTIPGNTAVPVQTAVNTSNINSQDPCEKLRRNCDGLSQIADAKKASADAKQADADAARNKADTAEQAAKDAEKAAQDAEDLTKVDPPSGRGSVDGGQEYTTADSAFLEQMNAQVNADYQSGKISVEEHQRRLKENTIEKARQERIKNEARLKKEAKEAKDNADKARVNADKANADANASQFVANKAKADAEAARKAFEDCFKKAEDECNKLKSQLEAERRKADEERRNAEAAEKRKLAEESRLASEERQRKEADEKSRAREEQSRQAAEDRATKERERLRTLYRQMYELGFISNPEFEENKVYLGFLLNFVENSVEKTIETNFIPKDVLRAFRNMTLIRNPCGSNIVKQEAWDKLESMINPRTGQKYTNSEAQDVLNEMCKLLRRLGARQDELKKVLDDA